MSVGRGMARVLFRGDGALVGFAQSATGRRLREGLDRLGVWGAVKAPVSAVRRWAEARESYEDKVRREGEYFSALDVDAVVAEEWYSVPRILVRFNALLGAQHGETGREYLATWLRERFGPIQGAGLDLACGHGEWPARLLDAGQGDRFDALDVAEAPLVRARTDPRNAGRPIDFRVADVNHVRLPANHYAVIFVHDALHHVLELEHVVAQITQALRPGGRLVLSDYVGPSRMQWTDHQLRIANGLLQILPEPYRRMADGQVKRRVTRPDPSFLSPFEAIRSAEIMPLLARDASLELREAHWSLSLLPCLLTGLAEHFQSNDAFARAYVDLVWDAEQALHAAGLLSGHYVVAVYERR